MEIFNKRIYGTDAEAFNNLDVIAKVNWIKKNTNQQNEELIYEFLTKPIKDEKGNCINCGTLDNKIVRYDSNISKNDVIEIATDSDRTMVEKSSTGNSTKRQRKAKRTKG